jgi:hypothetical protein
MMTSAHDSHDLLLIAAYAADDAGPADRERAVALIEACAHCADLASDIRSIVAATAALPPLARARDFRLTNADAARLRPAGWRRAIRALAGPRLAFTRPLAAGLTTLGLVGVIVTSVPIGMFSAATGGAPTSGGPAAELAPASAAAGQAPGAAGASPQPSAAAGSARDYGRGLQTLGAAASASPAPALGPLGASPQASPQSDTAGGKGGASTSPPTAAPTEGEAVTTAGEPDVVTEGERSRDTGLFTTDEPVVSPLFVLSAALLVCGLGLFLLRWTARRLD